MGSFMARMGAVVDFFFPTPKTVIDNSPITIVTPHEVPFTYFIKSPELLASVAALVYSIYLMAFEPCDLRVTGYDGLMERSAGISYARSLTPDGVLTPAQLSEPHMVSADLVLIVCVGLASTTVILSVCRLLDKAQESWEHQQAAEEKRIWNDPALLAAKKAEEAEKRKAFDAENAQREKEGKRKRRERVYVEKVDAVEILTNVLGGIVIVLGVVMAGLVQLQEPNQVRGYGAAILLIVTCGAMITPKLCNSVVSLRHYCGVFQVIFIGALVALVVRSGM